MEDMLKESINRTRLHKENLGKHQLTSLNCLSQFQNGMPSSLLVGGMQEAQPLTWLLNSDMIIPNESNYLPHRDVDVECSTNASVPQYTSYFGTGASTSTGKQSEVGDPGQLDNMGQIPNMEGGGGLNEFDINACLSTEPGQQYVYPYCSSNVDDKKSKPEMEMNLPTNPVDYQVSRNFELPISLYDNEHHPWLSSSGPSGISVYKENTYQQQPNMGL